MADTAEGSPGNRSWEGAMEVRTGQTPRGADVDDAGAGELNRLIGWSGMALGAGMGLLLGLWAFDGPLPTPAWIGDYDATPRRLLRLSHIACFGLGLINLLMAREAPRLALSAGLRRAALQAMNLGNVLLPVTLFAAALYAPLKYLMPLPALAVFAALCLTAIGLWLGRGGVR
jgi:hypothetical protein